MSSPRHHVLELCLPVDADLRAAIVEDLNARFNTVLVAVTTGRAVAGQPGQLPANRAASSAALPPSSTPYRGAGDPLARRA